MSPNNRPDHRIRVLALLARIARASGLNIMDVMDLALLRHTRNKKVREAANRFFETAGAIAPDASGDTGPVADES